MAQRVTAETFTMDPASASRRLAAHDGRSRRATRVGALAVIAAVAGWAASFVVVSRIAPTHDPAAALAGFDPSRGVPFSVLVQAPAAMLLALCASMARRAGGPRAASVVWVAAVALSSLAMAGVAAELRDGWVVAHRFVCHLHQPPVEHTGYERWVRDALDAARSVERFRPARARLFVESLPWSRADALGFAGGALVVALGSLRHRLGLRVERLVRPVTGAALVLLVASGVRLVVQPSRSGYVRGLPAVAVLPAIADPASDPRVTPTYGLDDVEDVVPDHRHLVERPPVRFVGRDADEPAPFVAVDDRWGDLVIRRECDPSARCSLYWRRGGEAMWSNGAFSWKAVAPFWFTLGDSLTVRHDARRRIAYATTETFTVAAIRLDAGPSPDDQVPRAELDLVPWRELSRDVAPPWSYVAFAAVGCVAAARRRRPSVLRVEAGSASVYRADAVLPSTLDDDVTRWNAARLEADALERLGCLALTSAPLVAAWLMG